MTLHSYDMAATIELFPAGNGDAILLDLETSLILIDCGYVSTYRDHIKPRLLELSAAGRTLTKMIITHIDADHIQGAIAFIEENGDASTPSVIGIDEIWFNSYRHLHFTDKQTGSLAGRPLDFQIPSGLASIEADDSERLVSFSQGTGLGSLILKNRYAWNTTFDHGAVYSDDTLRIALDADTTITVLGPTKKVLERLGNSWYTYLKKIFAGAINEDTFFDDAFEMMLEEMRQEQLEQDAQLDEETLVSSWGNWVDTYTTEWTREDSSPTNASSIIFLLEHKGKTFLSLADAIPSQVVEQLKKKYDDQDLPIHVDVLKVAHHGAWKNNSPELIQMIQADYFLFSSNGLRHRHPHLQTIAWILKSHQSHSPKKLVFNYMQQDRLIDVESSDGKAMYNYETLWPDVDEFGNGKDGYIKLTF